MNEQNSTFIFKNYDIDLEKGNAVFHYRLVLATETINFTERLTFPPVTNKDFPQQLLDQLLNNMLLILGISYWKTYCPKNIEIENNFLTKEQAAFWNVVYTKGLGEFFYKNQIDFRGLVKFPFVREENGMPKQVQHNAITFPRQNRSLVPLGGGKDSIVTIELLKQAKKPFTLFSLNTSSIQDEVSSVAGVNRIIIRREIDQKLFILNKQSDVYNGHVPFVAINAFISVFAAMIYDYSSVIVSNEKSSDFGSISYLGEDINHQWSKSLEFEQMFQQYISRYVTKNISYFSLLKPLKEVHIVQLFTRYPQYFPVFASCNRNFTITGEKMHGKWCGKCPKCAFMFAALAAFLPKEKVVNIFGKNLFEDTLLVILFQQLLGIKDIKPFECVGTPEETRYAMYEVYKKGEFADTLVMKMFAKDVLPNVKDAERLKEKLFTPSKEHAIPKEFHNVIADLTRNL